MIPWCVDVSILLVRNYLRVMLPYETMVRGVVFHLRVINLRVMILCNMMVCALVITYKSPYAYDIIRYGRARALIFHLQIMK